MEVMAMPGKEVLIFTAAVFCSMVFSRYHD